MEWKPLDYGTPICAKCFVHSPFVFFFEFPTKCCHTYRCVRTKNAKQTKEEMQISERRWHQTNKRKTKKRARHTHTHTEFVGHKPTRPKCVTHFFFVCVCSFVCCNQMTGGQNRLADLNCPYWVPGTSTGWMDGWMGLAPHGRWEIMFCENNQKWIWKTLADDWMTGWLAGRTSSSSSLSPFANDASQCVPLCVCVSWTRWMTVHLFVCLFVCLCIAKFFFCGVRLQKLLISLSPVVWCLDD